MIRAQNPCDATSHLLTVGDSINVVVTNVRYHVIYNIPRHTIPGLWYGPLSTWSGSGLLFLLLTALILCFPFKWDSGFIAVYIVLLFIALLNVQYALGGAARFWVPFSTLLTAILAVRVVTLLEPVRFAFRVPAFAAMVLVLLMNLGTYIVAHERQPFMPNMDWSEKAELFDAVSRMDLKAIGVKTLNANEFQLITGIPAPITDDVTVDHVITRSDEFSKLPVGTKAVLEVSPWVLYKLPKPMKSGDLTKATIPRRLNAEPGSDR